MLTISPRFAPSRIPVSSRLTVPLHIHLRPYHTPPGLPSIRRPSATPHRFMTTGGQRVLNTDTATSLELEEGRYRSLRRIPSPFLMYEMLRLEFEGLMIVDWIGL